MSINTFEVDLQGQDLRIGIVQSRFNEEVCRGLLNACLGELKRLGVADEDILVATVPGALEIPVALQKMAESQQFDALIAVGAVIKGETYHFELDFDMPIANAVLTTYTDEQAEARMVEKGTEAARVAVEMANLVLAIDEMEPASEDE